MYDEEKDTIDMAEIWRQNYMDALDEIRNLRYEINKLKAENESLKKDKNPYHYYDENSVIDFLG